MFGLVESVWHCTGKYCAVQTDTPLNGARTKKWGLVIVPVNKGGWENVI